MNVHDYATRSDRLMQAAGRKPCEHCGHPASAHRERGYETYIVPAPGGGVTLEERPVEGHQPGRCFCTTPGCDCQVVLV